MLLPHSTSMKKVEIEFAIEEAVKENRKSIKKKKHKQNQLEIDLARIYKKNPY